MYEKKIGGKYLSSSSLLWQANKAPINEGFGSDLKGSFQIIGTANLHKYLLTYKQLYMVESSKNEQTLTKHFLVKVRTFFCVKLKKELGKID